MRFQRNYSLSLTSATLLLSQVLATGFAQEAATPEIIRLDPVTTTETRQKDSSARLDAAEKSLLAVPGGVNFLSQSGAGAGLTLQQSLAYAPGVTAQSFFGGNDQPKIHVRGSGLQQNPVQRGLLFLADGLPLNLSDGSVIISCVDPRAASHLAVYRGPTGNVRGAAALGGAIELVSTDPTSAPPLLLSGELGSFGSLSATAGSAAHLGDFAGVATLGYSEREGFRTHNTSKRQIVRTLASWHPSAAFYLYPFLDYTNAAFDVPGPLPWAKLTADPTQIHTGPVIVPINGTPTATQAGPNVVRDQPRRESELWRGGFRSEWKPSSSTRFQAGVSYLDSHDMFHYPVSSGVQTTASNHVAVNLHGSHRFTSAPFGLEFNWLGQQGDFDKKVHHNNRGAKGDLFGRNDLEAAGSMLSLAATHSLSAKWSVTAGASWLHETRDNADRYTGATRPTLRVAAPPASLPASILAVNNSFARRYDEFLPQINVSFRPVERQLIFASVSRSAEVPTFDDLLTTTGGTPNSGPTGFATNNLAAQTATTFELGWRGALASRFTWDAVIYRANVEHELLVLRDASGLSRGTVNANKTTHLGGELGGTVQLRASWDAGLAYTYQDFRFNNDIAFRNNRLAGAARHHLELRSNWSPWNHITLGSQIHWRLDRAPVDNANTLFQPRYAVCDSSIRYKVGRRVTLYAELRNAFDEVYAASVNTTDVAASTQAVYLPGDGRSLHAGFVVQF